MYLQKSALYRAEALVPAAALIGQFQEPRLLITDEHDSDEITKSLSLNRDEESLLNYCKNNYGAKRLGEGTEAL